MNQSKVTRRRVLQGAASMAAASVIPGFVERAEAAANPTLNVQLTSIEKGYIAENFIGLSYDKNVVTTVAYTDPTSQNPVPLFNADNAALMNYFVTANVQSLRFGNGSDVAWNNDPNANPMQPQNICQADVNTLVGFLGPLGLNYSCQCLYSINLEGALRDPNNYGDLVSGTVATTTTLAGEEVNYIVGLPNSDKFLSGIEIGNEINAYQTNKKIKNPLPLTYNNASWSPSTLQKAWSDYQQSFTPLPPGIEMTGPAFDAFDIEQWNEQDGDTNPNQWNPTVFASNNQGILGLFTQHYYTGPNESGAGPGYPPMWYPSPGTSEIGLLVPSCNQPGSYLVNLLTALAESAVPNFRITECNSYDLGGAHTFSNAYGSALWAIDFMYTCAQHGSSGVNFHGGGYAASGIPEPVWYTPINNFTDQSNNLVLSANPLYYGIVMFKEAGTGHMYNVTLSPSDGSSQFLNGYAVMTGSNAYSIIVNNKYTETYSATLDLSGTGLTLQSSEFIQMTQTSSNINDSGGVEIQGQSVSNDGTISIVPTSLSGAATFTVPAVSTVIVKITTKTT